MLLVKNKKANFEYQVTDKLIAGVVLEGREVKSLRLKHASLTGSYIKVIGNEALLINAQINPYVFANNEDYDPKRTRKILLTKKEIDKIRELTQQKGWGVVPLSFETKGRNIKVIIGIGKGKKSYEKKAAIRERDLVRENARQLKIK